MQALAALSRFVNKTFALWVLVFGIVGYLFPELCKPLGGWITILLGIVMFGMGLTLTPGDFREVFRRPRDVLIGVLGQFIIMPSVAYVLCIAFQLPPDIAVGVMLVGVILYWFFGTELGTAIRATGCNSQMARAQGVNTNSMIVLGLLISNALVALSGALVCQANGFADVGMGTGTIVIGLASVIIGEVLFGTRSFKNCLISVILGSIVYRLVIAIVLQLGMPPNDLKLFTAILVAIALSMPLIREKWRARKSAL